MLFYSAAAIALLFTVGGMLIYRLGVSDGLTLRKSSSAESLFGAKKEVDKEPDWQSIIAYDHRKKS